MRLVDVRTGRVLWADGMEREGWDRQGLFRSGRIYSRGALTEVMTRKLIRRMLRETGKKP